MRVYVWPVLRALRDAPVLNAGSLTCQFSHLPLSVVERLPRQPRSKWIVATCALSIVDVATRTTSMGSAG